MLFGLGMGRYTGSTAEGTAVDRAWLANDGLVNTISALAPFDEPARQYVPYEKTEPGLWYVMPVQHLDHLAFAGGMFNMGWTQLRILYSRQILIASRSGR